MKYIVWVYKNQKKKLAATYDRLEDIVIYPFMYKDDVVIRITRELG